MRYAICGIAVFLLSWDKAPRHCCLRTHRRRLAVKPGITGLWQISADRDYLIHENIEYDLYYIRNRNIFIDLAILFHTAIFAARGV